MAFIDWKAGRRVVKILTGKLNRFKFPPAVIRVAIPALGGIIHIAMHTRQTGHLCVNILVAFRAQSSLISAQRLMAQAALVLKFSMREENTGGFPIGSGRGKIAWTKYLIAKKDEDGRQNRNRHDGDENIHRGKQWQMFAFGRSHAHLDNRIGLKNT